MANMNYLAKQMEPYKPRLLGRKNAYPILAAELGEDDRVHPDVLYIFDWKTQGDLVRNCVGKTCNIAVYGTDDDTPFLDAACHMLLIRQEVHQEELVATIQRILTDEQRVAGYTKNMFGMLACGETLQNLVDFAYQMLQNPVFVIDAGYRLIAANWQAKLRDSKSQRLLENRYLDSQDIQAINFDNIHHKVMSSDKPLLIKNPNYQYNRIIAGIKTDNKEVGHITVVESERPFHPTDYLLVEALRDVISQFILKNEFVRNSRGYNYEYLMADLLDGNVVMSKQLKDRLAYVDLHFEDLLYVIVAELGRSQKYVNPTYIRDLFEQLMPGAHSLLYNGQIVLLVTRKKETPIGQEEIQRFHIQCKEKELFCGMSNSFHSVADLQKHYKQALRALELGTVESNNPSLYRYEDYALSHLIGQFAGMEAASSFIHPVMQDLYEYDQVNDAELCYTLYMYLVSERSIAVTAEHLHVHRNTVAYRLKKLEGFVNVDLNDWKTRQYLIASYPILSSVFMRVTAK